jgi:type III secretion protein R
MDSSNIFGIFAIFLLTGLAPILVMMTTSFAKISIILFILRNALGVQQTPPNSLLYGLALILTAYVMMPTARDVYAVVADPRANHSSIAGLERTATEAAQPVRAFMIKHTRPRDRAFFVETAQKVWKDARIASPQDTDFIVLVPAFLSAELTRAFEISFLLYLPFVMIDFGVCRDADDVADGDFHAVEAVAVCCAGWLDPAAAGAGPELHMKPPLAELGARP